jgi:hypothetical protein
MTWKVVDGLLIVHVFVCLIVCLFSRGGGGGGGGGVIFLKGFGVVIVGYTGTVSNVCSKRVASHHRSSAGALYAKWLLGTLKLAH